MITQRISDRRMIVRCSVMALVCGSWLMAGLAAGQEAEPRRRKAAATPAESPKSTKQDERSVVRVYQLKYAEATSLAQMLASVGITDDKTKVAVDKKSNRLLVSASSEKQEQVSQFIELADKKNAEQDDERVTRIYNLKYAKAGSLAEVFVATMTDVEKMSVGVDERINVIIVSASREQQERVKGLLKVLDAPPVRDVARQFEYKIFKLVHAEARDLAEVITTFLGPDDKIAVDERTNSILAQGTQGTLLIIDAILRKLDEAADKDLKKRGPGTTFQVRVVWLANGLSADDAADPSADLKDVLDPLRLLGIKDLRQIGQVIVNTTPDGRFQVRCSPILKRPSDLEISGMFDEQQETPTLNIQVSATHTELATERKQWPGPSRMKQLVDLETKIVAPLGHYVVLGVAPVEKMTSVFIVQIKE